MLAQDPRDRIGDNPETNFPVIPDGARGGRRSSSRRMDETPPNAGHEPRSGIATDRLDPAPVVPPRLRRRVTQRVVGGVAGGLADRFGWPVTLIRAVIGFSVFVWVIVALAAATPDQFDLSLLPSGLIGGSAAAVVLYVVLWMTVPEEDQPHSALGRAVRPVGQAAARPVVRSATWLRSWVGLLLVLAGGAVLAEQLGIWRTNVAVAFGLIALGVMLYRREPNTPTPSDGVPVSTAAGPVSASSAPVAAEPTASLPVVRRAPRERSPLGWLTLGLAALVVGVTATVDSLGDLELRLVVYPAIALLVIASGLLVGTIYGRARWLIAPALFLVPATLVASVVRVPLEGGFGRLAVSPDSASEVESTYRRIAGSIDLDLSKMATGDERVDVDATIGFGDMWVIVPYDAHVVVTARAGLGEIGVGRRVTTFGTDRELERRWEPRFGDGATILLDLEIGVGNVAVYRLRPTRRELRELERLEERAPRGETA